MTPSFFTAFDPVPVIDPEFDGDVYDEILDDWIDLDVEEILIETLRDRPAHL